MVKKFILAGALVIAILLIVGISGSNVEAAPSSAVACILPNGCIPRESGSNAQWWADSWRKGYCPGHTSRDWIVTYRVNNSSWRNADQSKVRFNAAWWSLASYWKWTGQVMVINNSLRSGGGITVCLSGVLSANDVKGTYLWRKP